MTTRQGSRHDAARASHPDASQPARLVMRSGRWMLETSRLVAIDRNVMRPEHQRIVGSEAVLNHLRRNERDPRLADNAAQLMRSVQCEGGTFTACDGTWLEQQSDYPPAFEPGLSRAEVQEMLSELRAELLVLRASHQRLRSRVAELEMRQRLPAARPPDARSSRADARESRVAAPAQSVVTTASQAALPPPATLASALEVAPAVPAQTATAEAAAAEAPPGSTSEAKPATPLATVEARESEPAPGFVRMGLPPRLDLVVCLRQLLGSEEEFPSSSVQPPALSADVFTCVMYDDARQEVGVLALDARAAAELGGSLLGVPASAIEEQAKTGAVGEDSLAAASEVCNNLSGVVNRSGAGCHVTSGNLAPHANGSLPWFSSPQRRILALSTPSGGQLWLVAR